MIKVKELTQTCSVCPSQWEGTLTNGEELYIKYRYGYLSIRVNGTEIWGDQLGDNLDGVLSQKKMKPYLLKALIEYSNNINTHE